MHGQSLLCFQTQKRLPISISSSEDVSTIEPQRGYFWWPGLDQDIQDLGAECQTCLAVKHSPTTSVLHPYPWEWPPRPRQRIHINIAGLFQGAKFLVAVDAHSKWPEVEIMGSTTTKTIEVLRKVFASNGLPEQVVTDNDPQFVSEEFAQFVKEKTSLPSGMSLSHRLSSCLLTQRSSPHATTGVAQALCSSIAPSKLDWTCFTQIKRVM